MPILSYSTRRPVKDRFWLTAGLVLSVLAVVAMAALLNRWETAAARDIERALSQFPNVVVKEAHVTNYGGELSREIVTSLWIELKDVPGSTIVIDMPTSETFQRTDHLSLYQLGSFKFRVVDPSGQQSSIVDVGPDGEFASLFPCRIDNFKALVEHFDTISKTIAAWPEYPSEAEIKDRAGRKWKYSVTNARD